MEVLPVKITTRRPKGFSMVELLLVLAVIGILSAIAIPSYMGQRRRARVIGDAITNAKSLAMAMESRKAENGIYGPVGTYTWTAAGGRPGTDLAPAFVPKGNSQMNYRVVVGNNGLSYILDVADPTMKGSDFDTVPMYRTDQSGAELKRYNK